MNELPSIDTARRLLLDGIVALDAEEVPVGDATDRVLAEDVSAVADSPPFANSAMDGFALRGGAQRGERLTLVGEARAGTPYDATLAAGQAVRISTGAAVPDGADAVLQLELVDEHDGTIELHDDVAAGRNVRGAGEDLRAGTTVLPAGTRMGPAELAVAIGAGRATVRCARRPRVAVLATGDELVAPGQPLGPGQIHESNRPMLAALARREHADVVTAVHVPDAADATRAAIARALEEADLVVLSGGVSVGPHDHVKGALSALGVEEILWRIALRPGKPAWFGHRDRTIVLGLPGNPVSSYVTFVLFARPVLAALQGADPSVPRATARLAVPVRPHPWRDECVRVRRTADGRVEPTGPQGSHMLSSLVAADALAIVPRGEGELAADTEVELEAL